MKVEGWTGVDIRPNVAPEDGDRPAGAASEDTADAGSVPAGVAAVAAVRTGEDLAGAAADVVRVERHLRVMVGQVEQLVRSARRRAERARQVVAGGRGPWWSRTARRAWHMAVTEQDQAATSLVELTVLEHEVADVLGRLRRGVLALAPDEGELAAAVSGWQRPADRPDTVGEYASTDAFLAAGPWRRHPRYPGTVAGVMYGGGWRRDGDDLVVDHGTWEVGYTTAGVGDTGEIYAVRHRIGHPALVWVLGRGSPRTRPARCSTGSAPGSTNPTACSCSPRPSPRRPRRRVTIPWRTCWSRGNPVTARSWVTRTLLGAGVVAVLVVAVVVLRRPIPVPDAAGSVPVSVANTPTTASEPTTPPAGDPPGGVPDEVVEVVRDGIPVRVVISRGRGRILTIGWRTQRVTVTAGNASATATGLGVGVAADTGSGAELGASCMDVVTGSSTPGGPTDPQVTVTVTDTHVAFQVTPPPARSGPGPRTAPGGGQAGGWEIHRTIAFCPPAPPASSESTTSPSMPATPPSSPAPAPGTSSGPRPAGG
ncbi:hypothetical protein GCM10029964_093250 [Kibdelosporangium lantanae]